MKILVLGADGQVGTHLRESLPTATFWSRADLDLAHPQAVEAAVTRQAPEFIVNAAAYTAVDRAESEPDLAWRVNAETPAALARAARRLDAPLLHFSTDYVFDGASLDPYAPGDRFAPCNVYGRTKLAGELAVATLCERYWILRTSWVFSEHGHNFVKTMLRLARAQDSLRVVDDQRGIPTYAGDLARTAAALAAGPTARAALPYGVYHACGGSAVSWCQFAGAIIERAAAVNLIERVPAIAPIPTSGYPTPARRPANSVLRPSDALARATGVPFDWRSGLEQVIRRLLDDIGTTMHV